MRIYNNYDGWQMSRRNYSLGKVIYHDETWDLDNDAEALMLIIQLLRDDVIGLLNDPESLNSSKSIYSLTFIFKRRDDWLFNVKSDGNFNHMQYRAMFSNLKQTTHVTVIPKEKDA